MLPGSLIDLYSGLNFVARCNGMFVFFLDYKLRYIWQGKNNLSSTQFYKLIILLLSSNPKGLNQIFWIN